MHSKLLRGEGVAGTVRTVTLRPGLEARLSLCTWLLWPLLRRLVNLDVVLKVEPAGVREAGMGTLQAMAGVGGAA